MEFVYLIGTAIALVIIAMVTNNYNRKEAASRLGKEIEGFNPTEEIFGINNKSLFAYDENNQKLVAARLQSSGEYAHKIVEKFNKTTTYISDSKETAVFVDDINSLIFSAHIPICSDGIVQSDYLESFVVSKSIFTKTQFSALLIDEKNRQIYVFQGSPFLSRVIPFADIISITIEEDGVVSMSKSTLRTIGGAVVGGALVGGSGAVVGGLSGNSTQKKKVLSMHIKLLIRDISMPDCKILLISPGGIQTDTGEFKDIQGYAMQWKDTISVIIDSVDMLNDSISTASTTQTEIQYTFEDKLEKLNRLREKGIITDADFQKQKNKILDAL